MFRLITCQILESFQIIFMFNFDIWPYLDRHKILRIELRKKVNFRGHWPENQQRLDWCCAVGHWILLSAETLDCCTLVYIADLAWIEFCNLSIRLEFIRALTLTLCYVRIWNSILHFGNRPFKDRVWVVVLILRKVHN